MRKKSSLIALSLLGVLTLVLGFTPAHAAGVPGGPIADKAGDTLDPVLYTTNLQGNTGKYVAHAQTDMESWNLVRADLPGARPALKATWVLRSAAIPFEGNDPTAMAPGPYPGWAGYTYMMRFQVPQQLNNNPPGHPICDRAAPESGKIFEPWSGHHADGHFFAMQLFVQPKGTGIEYVPSMAYYEPANITLSADTAGFTFIPYKEVSLNDVTFVKGQQYDYSVQRNVPAAGKTTLTLTLWTTPQFDNGGCEGGIASHHWVDPTNTVTNVSAQTWNNTLVVLPTSALGTNCQTLPDPVGEICVGDGEDSAIGGFVWQSDSGEASATGAEDYDIGQVPATGDNISDGPTCWSATFGGQLPRNPLWTGAPCQIDSPVGPEWRATARNFTF